MLNIEAGAACEDLPGRRGVGGLPSGILIEQLVSNVYQNATLQCMISVAGYST